jgi:hypothetical protein
MEGWNGIWVTNLRVAFLMSNQSSLVFVAAVLNSGAVVHRL